MNIKNFRSFLFCFFILSAFVANAQNRTIKMQIEGIDIDSIDMRFAIPVTPGEYISKGKQTSDKYSWEFNVPDSVFSIYFLCRPKLFRNIDGAVVVNYLNFYSEEYQENNTVFFDNKENIVVNLAYDDLKTKEIHEKDKDRSNSLFFRIMPGTDPEVPLSILYFRKYIDWFDENVSYEDKVKSHLEYTQKYSDSYAWTKYIRLCKDNFKINDLRDVYNLYSEKNKATDQGVWLDEYITEKVRFTTSKFQNTSLPNWKTGINENIITDTTKYNLVIFSASWCGPCHKQIPLLKEIHNDLKSGLDIVYVSTDTPDTADRWTALMEKEQIPWRSVIVGKMKDEIEKKYFVIYYPLSYLVYPDGKFEQIDVRDEAKKTLLYELVENR